MKPLNVGLYIYCAMNVSYRYVSGKDVLMADALSRAYLPMQPTHETHAEDDLLDDFSRYPSAQKGSSYSQRHYTTKLFKT